MCLQIGCETNAPAGSTANSASRKIPREIKIISYSLFQMEIVQINRWKQANVPWFRQIDIALFPNFS